MIRLFTDSALSTSSIIELSASQSHYIKNVMRKEISDQLLLFNGRDGEWLGSINSLGKKSANVLIKSQTRKQTVEPDVWLIFAPVKNVKIDFLAQKATELGVSLLQSVYTQHTIVTRVNTERLRDNVIEAAEQSERLTVPQIKEAVKLSDIINSWPLDRKIMMCDESGNGEPVGQALSKQDKNNKWAILIGPEGGFSKEEQALLCKLPYVVPVGLGPRILRADTAAIAALTCWQEHLGDWDGKPSFRN